MLSSLHPKAMLACLLMCVSLALGDTQDSPKPQASNQPSNIVGGIAIKVNNDPITLYEIQSLSAKQHISKDKAQEILIAQRLKDQEIKRLNIAIDDMRL